MWRVGYETADPRYTQDNLQEAGQDDDRQGFGETRRVAGQHDRHGDGHRRRRAGNLRARPAEHRCKETDRNGAVEPRGCSHSRRDAKAESDGERHHHGSDTTREIAAQRFETVVHAETISHARDLLAHLRIRHRQSRPREHEGISATALTSSRTAQPNGYTCPHVPKNRAREPVALKARVCPIRMVWCGKVSTCGWRGVPRDPRFAGRAGP